MILRKAIITHSASYAQEAMKPRTLAFRHHNLTGVLDDGTEFVIVPLNALADADRFKGEHFASAEIIGTPHVEAAGRIMLQVRQ